MEKQLASKKPADLLTEIVATIADERIAAADIGMAVDPQQGNAKRRDMEAEALIKVLGAGKGKGNPEEKKARKRKRKKGKRAAVLMLMKAKAVERASQKMGEPRGNRGKRRKVQKASQKARRR